MDVLSLLYIAGEWDIEESIAKGAFSFWMYASFWYSSHVCIFVSLVGIRWCLQVGAGFFFIVALFMHFIFEPSVESNVQEKRDLEEKLVSCIQEFFLTCSCVCFLPFIDFFCLHDFWGIDYGPTGQVSCWRHRTSHRLGLVHRFAKFRKTHDIILIIFCSKVADSDLMDIILEKDGKIAELQAQVPCLFCIV